FYWRGMRNERLSESCTDWKWNVPAAYFRNVCTYHFSLAEGGGEKLAVLPTCRNEYCFDGICGDLCRLSRREVLLSKQSTPRVRQNNYAFLIG
ncbi:hypothetical protein, partial [Lelliottia nimipressuralis]|uniref:hypothetical protein n=1 Tax=Lelliottia nimipressuralis TaxID=69220 RepID=UPI001E5670D5